MCKTHIIHPHARVSHILTPNLWLILICDLVPADKTYTPEVQSTRRTRHVLGHCKYVCVYVVVRCGVYFDLMLRVRSPSQAAAEAARGACVYLHAHFYVVCDRSKRLRAVDREHIAARNRAQLIVCLMSPSPYRHNCYAWLVGDVCLCCGLF